MARGVEEQIYQGVYIIVASLCFTLLAIMLLAQLPSSDRGAEKGDATRCSVLSQWPLTGGGSAGDVLARFHRSFNYYWSSGGGGGGQAPNTATVSDRLCAARFEGQRAHPPVSSLFWVWGQFIAHSLVHTSLDRSKPMNVGENRFSSSSTVSVPGRDGQAEQVNDLAPYLDAYAVYGFEDSWFSSQLWDPATGRMLVSYSRDNTEALLPINSSTGSYMGGDVRANENVLLASMHSLWLREHNYWVSRLEDERPQWSARRRYEVVRHIVTGEIQAITYREWLPVLLGDSYKAERDCYNPKAKAVVYNEVATAVLRFGHSMVSEQFERRHPLTKQLLPATPLLEAFHISSSTADRGILWRHGADQYLAGALMQEAQQLDQVVTETLRARLFNMTNGPSAILDLVALNLARGRDHGLPSYQQMVAQLIPSESYHHTTYEQMFGSDSPALLEQLYNLYGPYNSGGGLDLWLGIMLEKRTTSSSSSSSLLGRIGSELITQQFKQLRIADPHFYLWDKECRPWLGEIATVKLSDVLQRVSSITEPRYEAFRIPYQN